MDIIKQNPFRILGLTGNATEKELQKQLSKIKAFTRVGKEIELDYDFSFLGKLRRENQDIQTASNQIERPHNKLLYSLFWFIKSTPFDDIALNNLKEAEILKAIEIWSKTLKEEVTSKNFTSYHNLSTLYIALALIDDHLDHQKLQTGLFLKGKLFASVHSEDISRLVTGNGILTKDQENKFIDELIFLLKPFFDKTGGIKVSDFISYLGSFTESAQKYASQKFTELPVSNIENKIERTINKRKDNPQDAEEYGEELYRSTKKDLTLLKSLLGRNNIQFQMIANKLANEILQCSIDFFNEHRQNNDSFDPGEDALRIAKYARSIGATGQTAERIRENLQTIQEWVDDKPNRLKQESVEEDIVFITNRLRRFQNSTASIENAKGLIVSCKPRLINIKEVLGGNDDFYLEISTAVVGNALGMLIEVVNDAQKGIQFDVQKFLRLSKIIESSIEVLYLLKSLDMSADMRTKLEINLRTIDNIHSKLQMSNSRPTRGASSSHSSDGCYIATMVYGNYDHPQVMILRNYRDEKLSNYWLGRKFIRLYYATSPYLVKLFRNNKPVNKFVKQILDRIIESIDQ